MLLVSDFFEQGFCEFDAFVFGVLFAFVFHADIAVVVRGEHDFHGFGEVGAHFISVFIEFM